MTYDTWDLVPPHPSQTLVESTWVCGVKCRSDGTVKWHKVRLVAERFHQQAEIDYHETFCPIVKPTTIFLILSLAISFHWSIRQLDVKNAFFHGHLTEEVYMKQSQGFIHPDFAHYVCKLKKTLYSLKQAPRAWFRHFSNFILSYDFACSNADPFMFVFTLVFIFNPASICG